MVNLVEYLGLIEVILIGITLFFLIGGFLVLYFLLMGTIDAAPVSPAKVTSKERTI